jgi:choline-sulfatase
VVDRPDIVLIMTDQQRFDQIGYASGGHFETPNLDRLAAAGVIFDTAYSASTVCVPSRVAMLTSLQPHRVPTQENRYALREGFWTVAHELRRAGYETALIGKAHFAPVHAEHGFETMRLCEHLSAQGLGPLSRQRDDEVDDYHDWLLEHGYSDWRTDGTGRPFPHGADVHPTGWVEREVLEFLERRDRGRPLFLVISFPHPHAPYNPPEPYRTMYDPDDSRPPDTDFAVNKVLPFTFQLAMDQARPNPVEIEARRLREFLATVRGLIRQIDDAVGRIVERIDLATTVCFFTSDHGDYAGHRGLLRKAPWIPFDDLARVPFFVTGAGIAGGRRLASLVQTADFAVTCLAFAGLEPPAGVEFDGRNLQPLVVRPDAIEDSDRAVFTATTMGWPMVRRGKYKYVFNVDRQAKVLFDLERDPAERVNLRRDPAYEDVVADLGARLRAELERPVVDLPAVSRRAAAGAE